MCLLKSPFDASSLPALALKITKGEYTPVPKYYSKALKQLVADMIQVDPAKRPTINEVLNCPLLRDQPACLRFKDRSESASSRSLLMELSLGHKKVSAPSKRLHIDCNSDEYSEIEHVISPKSQQGVSKYHDMPVKRIDNYMKEGPKAEKKFSKRGDQLKRRETSEPILTPKGHSKIENERKVMVKNNSQLNF